MDDAHSPTPPRPAATAPPNGTPRPAPAPDAPSDPVATEAPAARRNAPTRLAEGGVNAIERLARRRGIGALTIGVVLIVLAIVFGVDSFGLVALLVAGVAMLAIGWLGPRMEGHAALGFGAEGTSFELRARVAPTLPRQPTAAELEREHARQLELARAVLPPASAARASSDATTTATAVEPPEAEVVEGHGETIELDLEQLRALLAAQRVS